MGALTPRDQGGASFRAFWANAVKDAKAAPSIGEIIGGTDLNRAVRNTRMESEEVPLLRRALVRWTLVYQDTQYAPGSIILVEDKDVDWLKSEGYIELVDDEADRTPALDEEEREEELAEIRERWRRAKKHRS